MKVAIIQIENIKNKHQSEFLLEEMVSLVEAINSEIEVIHTDIIKISKPNPYSLIGSGKLNSYIDLVKNLEIDLVVINFHLTAIQNRNICKDLKCLVFDRTRTILEIFDNNAHSNEGKLQVKLAYLEYEKSRTVRSWTHLERQRGSLGKVGGPGEKQLELDHRMINEKIERLKEKLKNIIKRRNVQNKSRKNGTIISLVGYTSAGKSTLFKQLTKKTAKTSNDLFTTLDPRVGKINLNCGETCYLIDTVGFIHDLPHQLVNAFRATLEQINESDYIIHVQDSSSLQIKMHEEDVISVLKDLKIEEINKKMINVYNKIDLNPNFIGEEKNINCEGKTENQDDKKYDPIDSNKPKKTELNNENIPNLYISALNGDGCQELLDEINKLIINKKFVKISLNINNTEKIKWLLSKNIKSSIKQENKISFTIPKIIYSQMSKIFPT